MYICIYTSLYIHISVYTYLYIHTYMYVCKSVYRLEFGWVLKVIFLSEGFALQHKHQG